MNCTATISTGPRTGMPCTFKATNFLDHDYPVCHRHGGNKECSICLKSHDKLQPCSRLPCKHNFHKKCISRWLQSHNTCPNCRARVVRQIPQSEAPRTISPGFYLIELPTLQIPSTQPSRPDAGTPSFVMRLAARINATLSQWKINLGL